MGYPCAVGIAAPLSIVRRRGRGGGSGDPHAHGRGLPGPSGSSGTSSSTRRGRSPWVGRSSRRSWRWGMPTSSWPLPLRSRARRSTRSARDARRGSGPRIPGPAVEDFEAVAGRGVSARCRRPAGARRFALPTFKRAGSTYRRCASDRGVRGRRPDGCGDRTRAGAPRRHLVRRRIARGRGRRGGRDEGRGDGALLVTGDNEGAARRAALAAGIEEVHAGILRAKRRRSCGASSSRGRVAMVGDGINDAPASAGGRGDRDGRGTDIAIESADVVIVGNRLRAVVTRGEISRWSYRKTSRMWSWRFLFNGLGIPAAATGLVYPVWAIAAMAASVTSIFVNALWRRPSSSSTPC